MTLREALDLLELNERTLEQSMLESSLQNRLEHTELRHVLRVFEAYRKVNAFLNPSFNTQGDARLTIIDESLPGETPLEVTRASVPTVTKTVGVKERDTFSDSMIEEDSIWEGLPLTAKSTLSLQPPRTRSEGVNVFAMLGLVAAAFGLGVLVLGPVLSPMLIRPALSVSNPPNPSSVEPIAIASPPVVLEPPVFSERPVVSEPPSAPRETPPAPINQPNPPAAVVSAPEPVVPIKPPAPARPANAKPAPQPQIIANPSAPQAQPRVVPPSTTATKPRVPQARVVTTPRVTTPRATTPRVTAPRTPAPRVAPSQVRLAPRSQAVVTNRIASRVAAPRRAIVAAPSRRTVNQQQFSSWDRAGVVLRYRSWTVVPDAVRGLSANAFRAAVFVARDPASLPDIQR